MLRSLDPVHTVKHKITYYRFNLYIMYSKSCRNKSSLLILFLQVAIFIPTCRAAKPYLAHITNHMKKKPHLPKEKIFNSNFITLKDVNPDTKLYFRLHSEDKGTLSVVFKSTLFVQLFGTGFHVRNSRRVSVRLYGNNQQ